MRNKSVRIIQVNRKYFSAAVVCCLFAFGFMSPKASAQVDTSFLYTFSPNWHNGTEMVWYHQKTSLSTNEQDMPIYLIVDSLYTRMNVSRTDSQTWILKLEHFTKYDKISRTPYLQCMEPLRNAPLLLEFDSAFVYLRLANWQQWRDTLHSNLKKEFDRKIITLKTYSDYRKLYEQPEEVENVVLDYYLPMFAITGRVVDIWKRNPMVTDIKNPFKEDYVSRSGTEFFYIQTESPSFLRRSFSAETDESYFEDLAEDYLNYLKRTSGGVDFPAPRITLRKSEYHSFDMDKRNLAEFRYETSVEINGASTFLEYHIILLHTR